MIDKSGGVWRQYTKIAGVLAAVVAPGIVGYVCLRSTVEYFGDNVRSCSGTGRNRNCTESIDSAMLQALFTGRVDDGYVSSQPLLWVARVCALLYAVAVVVLIVLWLVRRVTVKQSLRRRRARMGMDRPRNKPGASDVDLRK